MWSPYRELWSGLRRQETLTPAQRDGLKDVTLSETSVTKGQILQDSTWRRLPEETNPQTREKGAAVAGGGQRAFRLMGQSFTLGRWTVLDRK